MRLREDESGQMLVMTALSLTMLLGFMALAVDVGILFRTKRNLQIAADAAAIAGALDYKYNYPSVASASAAARAAAAANGVTDGSRGAVVTPSIPPIDGPNQTSCGECVEVQVSEPNPTYFMKLFNFGSITVAARAVAGRATTENCMYLLGTSGADFSNSGAATINLNNCGLVDNSGSANAFVNNGSLTMNAYSIGVAGGVSNSGSESMTPKATTGIAASGDPLGRTEPSTAGCGAKLTYTTAITTTLSPGCYDGLQVTAAATLNLGPGLYVFNGDVNLGGSATLKGSGVTLYFNRAMTLGGSVSLQLSAPTSGYWNGILFYESPSDSNSLLLTGASSSNLAGIIYLPNAELDISGASSMQLSAAFVVKQLSNSGAISLTLNDYLSVNPSSPLAGVTLVE